MLQALNTNVFNLIVVFSGTDFNCLFELFRKNKCASPNVVTFKNCKKLLSKVDKPTPPGCLWMMDAIEVENDVLRHYLLLRDADIDYTLLAPDVHIGIFVFLILFVFDILICSSGPARKYVFGDKLARHAFTPDGTKFWFTGSKNEQPSFKKSPQFLV